MKSLNSKETKRHGVREEANNDAKNIYNNIESILLQYNYEIK